MHSEEELIFLQSLLSARHYPGDFHFSKAAL
jgi:hypothetical protein